MAEWNSFIAISPQSSFYSAGSLGSTDGFVPKLVWNIPSDCRIDLSIWLWWGITTEADNKRMKRKNAKKNGFLIFGFTMKNTKENQI